MIEFWNRLPREAGDSSTLEILNIQLDTFLSNLGKRVGQMTSRGPCQTQLLHSSVCNLRDEYPKRNRHEGRKKKFNLNLQAKSSRMMAAQSSQSQTGPDSEGI